MSLLRIAVISDTHDSVAPELHQRLAGAAEIWHLGDVCEPSVIDELSSIGPPLLVVRGNNDWTERWPLTLDLVREGLRFHLTHIEPRRAPPGTQVLLFGHSHEPEDRVVEGVHRLNPGALFRPRGGSRRGFAWLEIGAEAGPSGYRWLRETL